MRAEMLVVVRQLGVCVRRVLRSEAVLHGAMDSDRGLELSVRRIAKCAIAPFCHFLREVDSLHFPSESREPWGLWGGFATPSLAGLRPVS